jgi:hypothetical protein
MLSKTLTLRRPIDSITLYSMATNKMITVAIILVLIALIVLIIWSKFG